MTSESEPTVGARLRAEREARRMTLMEVEERCPALSKSTVSRIELVPDGHELPPSAALYAKFLGFELVRECRYDLRPLPRRRRRDGASK
jgi:transcriptional regulator with XRE-family HTH domain